jgi:hypothetical protein
LSDGKAGSTLTVRSTAARSPHAVGRFIQRHGVSRAALAAGGRTLRFTNGAHRASKLFSGARALVLAGLVIGLVGIVATPVDAATTQMKVVIVVGPTGSGTAHNIVDAKQLAAQARGYGALVVEVYSPNATFSLVARAAKGANVLIYMGHGSGWPSPYLPFNAAKKDGMGLNATAMHGNLNVKYYGETPLVKYIHLAPNSVVLLRGLCYSAGNSEPGKAAPTAAVGRRRVDNYSAGFLRTGAKAVFAEPYGSVSYLLDWVFTGTSTVRDVFMSGNTSWGQDSAMTSTVYKSTRNTWATAISQRDSHGKFRRSVVGNLNLTAATVRGQ